MMNCRHGSHRKARPCSFMGFLQTGHGGVIAPRERMKQPTGSTALINVTKRLLMRAKIPALRGTERAGIVARNRDGFVASWDVNVNSGF